MEVVAPFERARAAQALVGAVPERGQRFTKEARDAQVDELRRLFARELEPLPGRERAELIEALAAAASEPSWDYLRNWRSLSRPRARAVMARTFGALLRDAGITAD